MTRKVLITGATGTVGTALVASFSQAAYRVVGQYWSRPDRAGELKSLYGIDVVRVDLSSQDDFANFPDDIDILVNSAGVNVTGALTANVSIGDWTRTLAINLTAPFLISKLVLPTMIRNRWGRIINISSIYGLRGVDGNCPYNASKHGLSGLTKSIAKDYAASGITCNEICPGPIDSEMMDRIAAAEAPEGIGPTQYLSDYAAKIPAGRFARPREVATSALFLASDEAGYVNGTSVVLDGGWIA